MASVWAARFRGLRPVLRRFSGRSRPHLRLPHCHCERDRTDTNFGVYGRALLSDYAELNELTIPSEEGFGLEQTRLALAGEYQGRFGIESDRAAPPRGGEIAQLNTNE
jgi:hypothetical protein